MKQRMSRKKRNFIFILSAVIVIALAVTAVHLLSNLEQRSDPSPEGAGLAPNRVITANPSSGKNAGDHGSENDDGTYLYYNGERYRLNEQIKTLLILGIDDPVLEETEAFRNSSQADFLLLAVFDGERETCTLIQLNRDTMCEVPVLDTFGKLIQWRVQQLALAHTYGNGMEKSCENTAMAVSQLLYGINIDNYFALTMDAIPILNDLVGGVTVTVEDDFSAVDPTLVKGETVTLTAENVEHYVRARGGMDVPTNIARMRRQRTFIMGLFSAMSKAVREDASFALDAFSAVADSLVTDCSIDELSDYSEKYSSYPLSGILTPEGESIAGEKFMEFYVDETDLQQIVVDTFYIPVE